MKRITVVEDLLLFRKGLVSMLEKQGDIQVVAEFSDGRSFFEAVKTATLPLCDLIFLDLALPWMSGLELLSQLQQELDKLPPICILSMYPDCFYLQEAKVLGVKGYLHKNCEPETLISAIEQLTKGKTFFLAKEVPFQEQGLFTQLSERELAVFSLLTRGLTTKEIGYEMKISIKTVSTYKTRLMQKLGVESTNDLYKMTAMYAQYGA